MTYKDQCRYYEKEVEELQKDKKYLLEICENKNKALQQLYLSNNELVQENEKLKTQKEDKKCLSCQRMTVSQDEYITGLTDEIDDLKKENEKLKTELENLLSCAKCPENHGGYICEKEYNDKCLAQKIQLIKELEHERGYLIEMLR